MNPDKTWNEGLVWEIAMPIDVAYIMQILIPTNAMIDRLLWPYRDD